MTKPYNEAWIRARAIQTQAREWQRKGLLNAEQLERIKTIFPDSFYKANLWVKIALFLFTLLLNSCASGLAASVLFTALSESLVAAGILMILFGVGYYFILENFIHERRLFHSGIDNALLYSMVGSLVGGLCLIFSEVIGDNKLWLYGLLALPVLVWAVVRYASRLLTVAAFGCLLFIVFGIAISSAWGKALLPFIVMAVAGVVYFFVKKADHRESSFYWAECLTVAEVIALILFYAGGNYYVVREGNALLLGASTAGQIPFAALFYTFTVLIPVAYLAFAIRRKDRLLLRLGLLVLAASIVTFQHYFPALSWAGFLSLSGLVLIGLAWIFTRFLTPARSGFTAVADGPLRGADAEAFAIAHARTTQPEIVPEKLFGDGDFGGAGAGSGY
ncbi:MAG: hypothetical protein LH606_05520 [Cytophagaceae bacterium]|nr:hypothetical protein [Cytophagaceae bacterium]